MLQLGIILAVLAVLLLFVVLKNSRLNQQDPSGWRKQLDGKVVLITGASSGLGRACALAFCRAGCRLILSSRNLSSLMETKEAVMSDCRKSDSVEVLPLDLSDIESLPEIAQKALKFYGQVDVLVNNGGVSSRSSVLETDIAVDQQVMTVNYFGAVTLTKALLPHMVDRGSGHVVAISSIQGKVALPFRSSYSASKHALEAFFESVRSEVAQSGVHVTVVCPGYINTKLSVNAITGDGTQYGVTDVTTTRGMSPDSLALRIVAAVACQEEEVVVASLDARAAIYLRTLCPFILRKIMKRRAEKTVASRRM